MLRLLTRACWSSSTWSQALARSYSAQPLPPSSSSSSSSTSTVYGAGANGNGSKSLAKVTINTIRTKYNTKQPLSVITAYDYPSAQMVHESNADMLLVGDSVAMVVLGMPNTRELTIEDMLHHCKAVSRGASRPFLIGDLPFGTYEISNETAIRSSVTLLGKGGMDAVKMEGGARMAERAAAVVRAGIPVMGHVGLTPQTSSSLGGFVSQGKSASQAMQILDDALALQDAGCFSIVLESIPERVAAVITSKLRIPTIGIGAGPDTSGQVLVFHDMLGLYSTFVPKFCKQYGQMREPIVDALRTFVNEVGSKQFPQPQHCFTIKDEQFNSFMDMVTKKMD